MIAMTSHDGLRVRHPSVLVAPGQRFANLSEEIFARLLTLYGIEWTYEPVEFPLEWSENGEVIRAFRPDFYLPRERTFIELTVLEQRLVTKKNRKVREFRALYPELTIEVVYRNEFLAMAERHGIDPTVVLIQAA